jgi:hypothetical protein
MVPSAHSPIERPPNFAEDELITNHVIDVLASDPRLSGHIGVEPVGGEFPIASSNDAPTN